MVLDPKSGGSHNDYGTISLEGEGVEGPSLGAESKATTTSSEGGGVTGGTEGPKLVMTQSDVYQRQPLLTEGWVSEGQRKREPEFSEDDEDKLDGLRRNPVNGTVRIEVPTPLREEPRFPQEKIKTFIGKLILKE